MPITRQNYRIGDGRSIVFDRFLCFLIASLFIYFFVGKITRKRLDRLHEIFREGVEWPWDDVIQFWVNSERPRGARWRAGFVVLSTTACCNVLIPSKLAHPLPSFAGQITITHKKTESTIFSVKPFAEALSPNSLTLIIWYPYCTETFEHQLFKPLSILTSLSISFSS